MRIAAEIGIDQVRHQRAAERFPAALGATLREQGRNWFTTWVVNISTHGCRIEGCGRIPNGTVVWLKLPGIESWQGRIAWTGSDSAGVEFERALYPAVLQRILQTPLRRGF
jgi:hypothetical protein